MLVTNSSHSNVCSCSSCYNSTSFPSQSLDEKVGTFLLKITKAGKLNRKIDLVEGGRKMKNNNNFFPFTITIFKYS